MTDVHGGFLWYELMTTDMEAAKAFYRNVIGWSTQDNEAAYTLFTAGEEPVAGLTELPAELRKMGMPPRWIGYVSVDDVDAADRAVQLGGFVQVPPTDITGISRYSVVADPQAAIFVLIKRFNPAGRQAGDPSAPGRVGWHELFAADWQKAFAFYRDLFGWQQVSAGADAHGTYAQFAAAGQTLGGMFTKPAQAPIPFWLYYFNTADLAAAAKRVAAGGGRILEGPLDLPSGGRAARCLDPQGAMFALIGQRNDKAIGYFEPAAARDPAAARFFVPKKPTPA